MGPRDMGEGGYSGFRQECGVGWRLRCRLGAEWVSWMLLCFVPADEGGTQVYVVVEAVEGRCKSSGICGCH